MKYRIDEIINGNGLDTEEIFAKDIHHAIDYAHGEYVSSDVDRKDWEILNDESFADIHFDYQNYEQIEEFTISITKLLE